jgi:RNA polymerase sigma-70 factor (ECF subfamily)
MSDESPEVEALRRGDQAALSAFYRSHARRVLGWVIRLGGSGLDAEDVAHDVFATALGRLHTLRDDTRVTPWLYGVTRRVVANKRRRAAFRRFIGLEREPAASGPTAEDHVAGSWARKRVQQALDTLSDKHREAVVLCDLEEYTAVEAADMIGVSVGTVYSRLHYGRQKFQEALRADAPQLVEQLGVIEEAG